MNLSICGLLAITVFAVTPGPSCAASLTSLVSFCALANCTDGLLPVAGLIADADGNLFGTTADGGANGGGTVFEIRKTRRGYASAPTILVSFCDAVLAICPNGSFPEAGLIADADGNLFGTTGGGGAHNGGTVFEIAKTATGYANSPTTLVSFCALPNCADGANPRAGLIADAKGNLFGTTFNGGAHARGTVFEIRKTRRGYASAPTILVSFCALPNCADGARPLAGLIADVKGNLFGTTLDGGANGEGEAGTVFEIRKTRRGHASAPIILVSFCALPNCADGEGPTAGLIADADGNLFGTTNQGGANVVVSPGGSVFRAGTVFKVAKTTTGYASAPTTLVSFCALPNCADGETPLGGLIADANGNLFGTTAGGGVHGGGTAFEIAKTATGYASTPTTLVNFCALPNCADGFDPETELIADGNGNLFGTTTNGGANGEGGTVYEITDRGFVVRPIRPVFAGMPGTQHCFADSVSALGRQYGGLNAAAEALGYPSVPALQNAILEHCET